MATRAEQATSIWPHLPTQAAEPQRRDQATSPLAASMYPAHVPKPPRPAPAPRAQASPQEVAQFWRIVDPAWAASIGLRRVR
jgi:hypothetical protein